MIPKQETFDRAVGGVLKQGGPSITSSFGDIICTYRGANGRKCAAGQLIPDEAYDPMLEGQSLATHSYAVTRCVATAITRGGSHDLEFLAEIQDVHDTAAITIEGPTRTAASDEDFLVGFRSCCAAIADAHGLDKSVLGIEVAS